MLEREYGTNWGIPDKDDNMWSENIEVEEISSL